MEALRVGIEVIGQEYVVARMGWMNGDSNVEKAQGEKAEDSEKK